MVGYAAVASLSSCPVASLKSAAYPFGKSMAVRAFAISALSPARSFCSSAICGGPRKGKGDGQKRDASREREKERERERKRKRKREREQREKGGGKRENLALDGQTNKGGVGIDVDERGVQELAREHVKDDALGVLFVHAEFKPAQKSPFPS